MNICEIVISIDGEPHILRTCLIGFYVECFICYRLFLAYLRSVNNCLINIIIRYM